MTARPRRRRRATSKRGLRRWFRRQDRLTRTLLFSVIGLAGLIAVLMLPRENRESSPRHEPGPPDAARKAPAPRSRAVAAARPAAKPARVEPAPSRPAPPETTPLRSRPAGAAHGSPRAAIVFDDLGQRLSHFEQVASLEIPLTIAVIPGLPATAATVREASRLGIEMLLHQPMEPREELGKNPGAGVLLSSMSAGEVRERVRGNLAAVPGAVGVNNHMGSRFTEETVGLAAVMAELKAHGLFWLDSRTTPATRGPELAGAAGVPAVERDVFLDAEVSADAIRGQLRRLLSAAREHGTAIGIGHPHPETIATVAEMRSELLGSGVTLVPLSALVPPAGPGPALAAATGNAAGNGPGRPAPPARR